MDAGPVASDRDAGAPGAPCVALDLLGVGLATSDRAGRLVEADPRFLHLHGIVSGADGLEWPAAILRPESRLSKPDATAVAAAWSALAESRSDGAHVRRVVRLAGDRILEIGRSRTADDRVVLVARDGSHDAQLSGSLLHDVNNAVGSMLAHLYLAMSDVDADHPARPWLEAVNRSTLDLRERVRRPGDGKARVRRGSGEPD